MAYTVNKTNSAASPNQYTVQDGVVNTQTDLSFVGKGYAGYGEVIAENFGTTLQKVDLRYTQVQHSYHQVPTYLSSQLLQEP
jgi:hypothetical protein